jgi:hypothetical protein
MSQVVAYELLPSDEQKSLLTEFVADYLGTCNRIADIMRHVKVTYHRGLHEDRLASLKVCQKALDASTEFDALTESGNLIVPSRYKALAVNRVHADLGRDLDKTYNGDEFVNLDKTVMALKTDIFAANRDTMELKMFRSPTKVRLPIPCRYGEVEGFDWLPAGRAILVHRNGVWRVVVALRDSGAEESDEVEWFTQVLPTN